MWKDIPGYEEAYKINAEGEIYSCKRYTRGVSKSGKEFKKLQGGKYLKAKIKKHGYRYVTLCKNGVQNNHHIHRLVLRTFVGEPPTRNHVSCHNDGDTSNNKLENLRWDTVSNNHADKIKHGTHNRGDKSPTKKLSSDQVKEIKKLYSSGKYSQTSLAEMFGVCQQNISTIVNEKTWRY